MGEHSQLVVIGAGGHALSVADAALSSGWSLGGFLSSDGTGPAESLGRVFSSLESFDLGTTAIALGIGANYSREDALQGVMREWPGANLVSVVHKTAWVSPSATLHPGAVILAHASVGPASSVGLGALMNTGASVDHETLLGDFCSLGPGARTGGRVHIGPRTMIGMHASILQGVSIGSDSVIGAHAFVNEDIESNIVSWGIPARRMRSRERDDRYY